MSAPDPIAKLRHDLANPLSAVLAEVQMLLMQSDTLPPDTLEPLRAIEQAAIRMRVLLRESAAG